MPGGMFPPPLDIFGPAVEDEGQREAVEASADSIAGFGSGTDVLVASDVSGSMRHPVSRNSTVENYDVGIILSMLLQSRCGSVVSGIFGDVWKVVNLPRTGILANSMRLRDLGNRVGFSTNGHLVIDYLVENGIRMDKVMIFTDCQMWDSSGTGGHIRKSWQRYRGMFPGARLYLFDLCGYGQPPLRLEEDGVALIAGWSDRVFDILEAVENGSDAIGEINRIEL